MGMSPILASPPNIFSDLLAEVGIPAFLIFLLAWILIGWCREFRSRTNENARENRP